MKILTKPMSSPSRIEKLPPPLMMRFLRTNVGSRSRGKSRSSPMFIRKKNASIETQLEPSSPKVTCIGQVRDRRSKKPNSGGLNNISPARLACSCSWVRKKALFCHHFAKRLRPRSWFRFSPFEYCRSSNSKSEMESNRREKYKSDADDDDEDEDEDEAEVKIEPSKEDLDSYSTPKNAFLLTRCRSAPYRSSSLASRFWGSETGDLQRQLEDRGGEGPTSERESSCRDSTSELETGQRIEGNLGEFGRAYVLTRCKSEPARSGERLNPEVGFQRERRLGFAEPPSTHVSD